MRGYIRSTNFFEILKVVDVISYDLPIESLQGESGSCTVAGAVDQSYKGLSITFDGFDAVFKIGSVSDSNGAETTFSILDGISILDGQYRLNQRDRLNNFYEQFLLPETSYGNDTRARSLPRYSSYIVPQDVRAFMNTLNPNAEDFQVDIEEYNGELRSVEKAVRYLQENGVICLPTIKTYDTGYDKYNSFCVDMKYTAGDLVPVVFHDGHAELIAEAYDYSNIVSAVACYVKKPKTKTTPAEWLMRVWYYLKKDGTISATLADQMAGNIQYIYAEQTTVVSPAEEWERNLEAATAVFAQNVWKHSIKFDSDKEYHIGQPVRLVLDSGVLDTAISKVAVSSETNRKHYFCGDLPATTAEHIKANGWTYGARLPLNPKKGDLVFI